MTSIKLSPSRELLLVDRATGLALQMQKSQGNLMSTLDEIMEENMVCATVHAPHAAMAVTMLAYLAAHRPDRSMSFKISAPSADAGDWCERVLADAGVSLLRSAHSGFVGTAPGQIWTKLLMKHGEVMESRSILLSPIRPGNTR